KPRYTCLESALTMVTGIRDASHIATALLPAAVGPQITAISATAESALNLVPCELHDRRAAMNVVRRQFRIAERDEQRTHLPGGKLVAGLDRGLARDGGRQSFVPRVCPCITVASQRGQCLPHATLGVEARMRHRDSANKQSVSAKAFDLES